MIDRRGVLLGLGATVSASCGVVEAVQDTAAFELIGLGPDITCDVDRFEARRTTGAFLQIAEGSAGGTTFFVSGRARPTAEPLPRNLIIDDSKIRALSSADDGTLSGFRQSTAEPIVSLNTGSTLPLAYTLSYRVDGANFSGPLVIGLPPRQEEIPLLGLGIMTGFVEMTRTSVDNDGAQDVTKATGRFEMRIGYGSGRAEFSVESLTISEGPELPFEAMRWTRLGLCGARLVSSGQGILRLFGPDQIRVPVFDDGTDPAAGSLIFESSLFANETRPSPPGGVGGVFAVQGDSSSLTGVFLSQTATTA